MIRVLGRVSPLCLACGHSKVHRSASRHRQGWGGTSGQGLRAPGTGPISAYFGSPQGFADMGLTHADTMFDAGRRTARPPLGLTLAQRGGRCQSREGGWRPGPLPGGRTSQAWEGFVGGARSGENAQRAISGRENTSKGTGHTDPRAAVWSPSAPRNCELPPGLYRVNGHPPSATSSSPTLATVSVNRG